MQPDVFWAGQASPWRARVEAVLVAFAEYAAELDGAVHGLLQAFGGEQ